VDIKNVGSVTYETACQHVFSVRIDDRHGVTRGELSALLCKVVVAVHHNCAGLGANESGRIVARKALTYPITGIATCCARVAIGHAAALSPAMKSRLRIIQLPRRRAAGSIAAPLGRAPSLS
jgi:hypothetical protein